VIDVFGLLGSGTCQVLAKGQENTHTRNTVAEETKAEREETKEYMTRIDDNDSAAAAAHHPAQ